MTRLIVTLFLCLHLLTPVMAQAQDVLKAPFNYSLRDYGLILATAVLGGLVGWFAKVRRKEAPAWGVHQMIGELATSAFAGLLAFWICEWANFPQLLTLSLVGISGHAGTAAIQRFERLAEQKFGALDSRKDAP